MKFGLKIVRDQGFYKVMDGLCLTLYFSTIDLKEAQKYIQQVQGT